MLANVIDDTCTHRWYTIDPCQHISIAVQIDPLQVSIGAIPYVKGRQLGGPKDALAEAHCWESGCSK
jgi:hypothetical protein